MRRGFTLAELLGVIVVISLLLLLIIPSIINGVRSREDEVETAQNEIIFEATSEYLDSDKEKYPNISGNIYCVSIGQLLDAGLLVDPVKKLVEDGDYSKDATVEVKITNDGARSYSLIDDGTGEKCTARSSDDIMITINPDNSQWSQQKTVTITYPNLGGTNQYNNGKGWQSVSSSVIELTYTAEGSASGQVIDSNGNVLADETEKVEKIDRENPKVIKISQGEWNNNLQKQVNVTMTDAKSGVSAYMISTSKTKPSVNDKNWVKYELSPYGGTGTISEYLPMGTYYVYVKDRAGNILDYNASGGSGGSGGGVIEVKDEIIPTCKITISSGTLGNNGWYRSNVGLKMTTADEGSGVATYGLTTSKTATYNSKLTATQTADTKSTTYYGYVKDKAGNVGKCSISVKKDSTGPSISSSNSSNSGWTNQNVVIKGSFVDNISGTNGIVYRYSQSGTSYSDWDYTPTTSFSGTWSAERNDDVYLVATDKAGNTTTAYAGKVMIDKTAPSVWCGFDTYDTSWEHWGSCNSSDWGSGVSTYNTGGSTYYYVRPGANCSYNGPFQTDIHATWNDGTYAGFDFGFWCGGGSTVSFECPGVCDKVGNCSGWYHCGDYSW